jgi:hypothetical protein
MKLVLAIAALIGAAPAMAQSEVCAQLEGAVIINDDDEYIGQIANPSVRDSIFNEYGEFGSEYRSESIWNEYGKNGSEYRPNSAFNDYATRPPRLIKNRQVIGYLTVNKSKPGGLNPRLIGIVCYDFKPPH